MLNPVLPAPRTRRIQTARNAVDVIPNARSVADLRLYEWEDRGKTPTGKTRWYDTDTKKTRYQISKPGTGRGKKAAVDATAAPAEGEQPAAKQPAQKKQAAPRKPKVDHSEIGDRIEKMLGSDFPDQDVGALREELLSLTGAQLVELQKRFALKGGRTKADRAGRIAGHVGGSRKKAGQPAEESGQSVSTVENLPDEVRAVVSGAVKTMKGLADSIAQGRRADAMFGGGGRYEADAVRNFRGADSAQETLEKFRKLAAENGVDADAVLRQMGIPTGEVVTPSKPAAQWLAESAPAPEKPARTPNAVKRNRLTAGVKPQGGGDGDRESRIEKYRQRAGQKKPLFNARNPVDVVLHARSPQQARPLLYAWLRTASKRNPSKTVWVNSTNPKDRRYQESMPRQRATQSVESLPPQEHLQQILEAPYKVADYYLTSLQSRLRRMRPGALAALRMQFDKEG